MNKDKDFIETTLGIIKNVPFFVNKDGINSLFVYNGTDIVDEKGKSVSEDLFINIIKNPYSFISEISIKQLPLEVWSYLKVLYDLGITDFEIKGNIISIYRNKMKLGKLYNNWIDYFDEFVQYNLKEVLYGGDYVV